jgi:hypothetical protein
MTEWPTRVVLQNKDGKEEQLLEFQARILRIPVIRAGLKQIERRRVVLTKDDLVAGSVPFMIQAMHQLNIPVPAEDSYPDSLAEFMGREYRQVSSLKQALYEIDHSNKPRFIKPINHWKRFTGFVQYPEIHDYRLGGVSRRLPVWSVEPISIVSEWRAYVVHHAIVSTVHYDGDDSVHPYVDLMTQVVQTYGVSGSAPDGYAIDFLVDSQGCTWLLEANGGFSVGAYDDFSGGVGARDYWQMTAAYWKQLVQTEITL